MCSCITTECFLDIAIQSLSVCQFKLYIQAIVLLYYGVECVTVCRQLGHFYIQYVPQCSTETGECNYDVSSPESLYHLSRGHVAADVLSHISTTGASTVYQLLLLLLCVYIQYVRMH